MSILCKGSFKGCMGSENAGSRSRETSVKAQVGTWVEEIQ